VLKFYRYSDVIMKQFEHEIFDKYCLFICCLICIFSTMMILMKILENYFCIVVIKIKIFL